MDLGLKGKRVLVAGSSRGIGLSIGIAFAIEGARVCFTARSLESLEKIVFPVNLSTDKIVKHCCDFTNERAIVDLKNFILAAEYWKEIDILIFNVGSGESLLDPIPDAKQFNSIFQLNFFSAVNTFREFLPLLIKSKGCGLVISSICGLESLAAPIDYSIAKSALNSFVKNFSHKVGHYGIRINAIAPGNILFSGGTWDKKLQNNKVGIMEMIQEKVPLKRFGTPEEIAATSLFLCSEQASFITGSILAIDGGQTIGT
ncbi:MAG: SDR family oxidoreductase [Silvanigrellaceae bacterium]|nr:SDR family oxidoreductase [Silvanigrellaceae bacterium]